jgi:hypothetical protein
MAWFVANLLWGRTCWGFLLNPPETVHLERTKKSGVSHLSRCDQEAKGISTILQRRDILLGETVASEAARGLMPPAFL